jgi:flagellar hook assembly protein FlgD
LDGQENDKIDLTNLFGYDSGSYTRGSVVYQLDNLSEGRHTVEIKAWDNLNNSNTMGVEFVVRQQERLALYEVMNYPNPFRDQTAFTFDLNLEADVRVKIYTLAGRLIRTLDLSNAQSGFNMLPWDGRDEDGDELANGVYIYKVIATQRQSSEVLRAEEIGKLVVQR